MSLVKTIKNKLNTPITFPIILFILITIFAAFYINDRVDMMVEDERLSVAIKYQNMIDTIQNFISENVGILAGLSAYIQMNDEYPDEDVYQLLEILLKDRLDIVLNISVFQDTTAIWVYPLEGNEAILGVDLTTIPAQVEDVLYIKESLGTLLVGPVNLVQGGEAFIIRTPIVKNDIYWGMTSLVLDVNHTFDFINNISNDTQMRYLITYTNEPDRVIYGDSDILKQEPMMFKTDHTLGAWDIYVVPSAGWLSKNWAIIAFIISIITAFLLSYNLYLMIRRYTRTLEEKNTLENKYSIDRFTGVYTREYFNARAYESLSESERQNYPISMIYFDIDNFKIVNDTYGHSAGDDVLLNIVQVVNEVIRIEDVFARWGGDEFIILLPYTNLTNASIVAERIRFSIENMPLSKGYNVTTSIGCSQWITKEYFESWFARTDEALYEAKNSGRNRVVKDIRNNRNQILYKITWQDSWKCGENSIDEEHMKMVEQINKIIQYSFNPIDQKEVSDLLETFIHNISEHFKNEIQIISKLNYPDATEHAQIHESLMSQAWKIFDDIKINTIDTSTLYRFLLNEVVINHLLKEDIKFFSYFEK